jgi:hypothetical protein
VQQAQAPEALPSPLVGEGSSDSATERMGAGSPLTQSSFVAIVARLPLDPGTSDAGLSNA